MPHKEGGYRAISGRYIVDAGGVLYSHCLSDAGGVVYSRSFSDRGGDFGQGLGEENRA